MHTKYLRSVLLVSLMLDFLCWRFYQSVVTELIYACWFLSCSGFFIFVADGRVYLVWTSSSVASTYIIVRASMNLHSGWIQAVFLPSVWGQVVYVVLVGCLMVSDTSILNTWHVDVISPFWCCYVKVQIFYLNTAVSMCLGFSGLSSSILSSKRCSGTFTSLRRVSFTPYDVSEAAQKNGGE